MEIQLENGSSIGTVEARESGRIRVGRGQVFQDSWGIATQDRNVCLKMIDEIVNSCGKKEERRYVCNTGIVAVLAGGVHLRWIDPSDSSRGTRYGRMWCDKNMSKEYYQTRVAPMFRGRRDDIVWFDGKHIDMNYVYEIGTGEMTVGGLLKFIKRFPEDYSISLCGINSCSALVDFEKQTILLDDSDWIEEYVDETLGGEICTEKLK